MSYFGSLITSLGSRLKDVDVTVPADRIKTGQLINQAYKWVYRAHFWEYRRRIGEIVQIPNYVTGTCSVTQYTGTNDSAARKVTFSVALPSGMAGMYLKVQGESNWHRILYTAGSVAYLQTPILVSTSNSLTFVISKRFYYLPSDVDVIASIGKWDSDGKINYRSPQELEDMTLNLSTGSPTDFSPFGDNPFEQTYSTGTITVPADSNIVTGVGTAWLGNIDAGDFFIVNSNTYRVKRVETDTQLILYNYISGGLLTSSNYVSRKDITVGIQLSPTENAYRIIPYTYYEKAFDMIHETLDKPNLPDEFDEAILSRAEFKFLKDKDNSKWASVSQLYDNEMESLKAKKRVVESRDNMFKVKIHASMPGRY